MRAVSKKRAKELRERKRLTDAMKREGPVMCAFGGEPDEGGYYVMICGNRADDLHEIQSRARGGSITDPANTISLCRPHHIWVTEHPLEAKEMGLSK